MDKKMLFVAGGVVFIGLGVLYVIMARSQVQDEMAAITQTAPSENGPVPEPTVAKAGMYVDYSDTIIATTPGTKVLFFYAPWCPQCVALDKDIKASGVPDNVTIIKVDYDSHMQLRQKYGITIQTTFVRVDDSGNLVKKFVAYAKPTFANVKENVLQ